MANPRTSQRDAFVLHSVKMTFQEWLPEFVQNTIDNGHMSCPKCGSLSKCQKVERDGDYLIAEWQCSCGHHFTERADRAWFHKLYDKIKPRKTIEVKHPNIQSVRRYMASKL